MGKEMIRIQNLRKEYHLGQIGYGTLQRDLQSWWARKRNKEDPNSIIGQEQRIEGDVLLALKGIDLTVEKGECLGIIGGNGAGKSTLLKLISRVASPTAGSIDLYGRVTSMLEVGTGFNGDMTGRENIYLNGTILGMKMHEIDEIIEEIIDFSEVRDFIDTPVKRYSSGMYVKLGFAVASHLKSEIVIMDEVLAVGDLAFQQKCINKMRQVARDEDRTILYVSHNMNTVKALCDRCIVLAEGEIIFDGDVEDAISHYNQYLQSDLEAEGDLLSVKRRDRKLTGLCRTAGLKITDEYVDPGEDVQFDLTLKSEEDMQNVRLRLIVCNGMGEIVGMSASNTFPVRTGLNTVTVKLPLGSLAPGTYACDIAVFEFENATERKHDFLSKILKFTIEEKVIHFGRPWKIRTWGNINLEPTIVEGHSDERHE